MRKRWLLGLVVLTLGLLIVGGAAPALAHSGETNISGYSGAYIDGPTLVRLAQALGLTPEELSSALQEGQTLAEIAQKQNVSEETLIAAIVAPYASQLELQVRYGYLTQEQADALLETARTHASSLLKQDLSSAGGTGDWWQEMGYYCGSMMGNYGYGGMMGGWYGAGYGPGGMTGSSYRYNDSAIGWIAPDYDSYRGTGGGWTSTLGRFWDGISGRGGGISGGMMGGGMMGGYGRGGMGGWGRGGMMGW